MKVLIASTRELCYFSGTFFLNRIQEELETAGVEVVRLDFTGNETDFSDLEEYIGQQFDAIIDINSKLPYLIDENNHRILDVMEAPFFNYILDHPLYHHGGLSFPIKNYYAIGIDSYHCSYMKAHYDNLKEVFCLPMAGTKAFQTKAFPERKKEYLFMGTYLQDDSLTHKIRSLRNEINNATYQLALELDASWNEEKEPMEEALEKILLSYSGGRTADEIREYIQDVYELSGFSELLNHMFLVDQKKRNERRLEFLQVLAKQGEKIDVYGEGWKKTNLTSFSNVTLKPGCEMGHSFHIMGEYQKIFDVNPLFFKGFHDRVLSAMANGCLCVSDMPLEFDKELVKGENIVTYKRKNIGRVIEELAECPEDEMAQIADAGHRLWGQKYTWKEHAGKLLEILRSVT